MANVIAADRAFATDEAIEQAISSAVAKHWEEEDEHLRAGALHGAGTDNP